MTAAFGFSVGDFISAIELCAKVAKALNDTTGASAEYQHAVLELQALQNALSRLASLEPTESNINHVNAIRGMALACQFPLREFLSNLEKYEKTMGPFARNSLRGAGHKAKWAVLVAEEVKKIRALVSAKTISINLLLNMHTSEAVSRLESRGRSQHNELLRNIEEHRLKFQGISKQVEEVKDQVVQARQAASTQAQRLETEVRSRLEGISEKTTDLAQSMSGLRLEVSSAQNSILGLRDSSSQILAFLRKFPSDIRKLLQSIIWTNLRMYHVLLKIDGKVSASPSMLSSSAIRFEDALGVVRELPHQWFQHWEPFEGLLQAHFKNAPGENKVLQGQYHISFAKRPGVFIGKEDWTRSIQPGSEIVMSVLMTEMRWQKSSCPRPSCSGKPYFERENPVIVVCPLCGLKYFPLPSTFQHIPDRLTATEDEYVSKTQAEEDLELFGNRDIPTDVELDRDTRTNLADNNSEITSTTAAFETSFHPPGRLDSLHESRSSSNLVSFKSSNENMNASLENDPKIRPRFTREAIKVLRTWLSTRHRHPYLTNEENEALRHQTGLNQAQITNWLADARRRGKVRPRSVSPNVGNHAIAFDISRRATSEPETNEGGVVGMVDVDIDRPKVSDDVLQGHKPPLLSWLDRTESPENPTLVQSHLQERQALEEKAKLKELEEIELFRNVHVVLAQHESDHPAPRRGLSIRGEDELELAARIYYSNIVDRYPAIPHYLARRLAEANLCRAKRLSDKKLFTAQQKDAGKKVPQADLPPELNCLDTVALHVNAINTNPIAADWAYFEPLGFEDNINAPDSVPVDWSRYDGPDFDDNSYWTGLPTQVGPSSVSSSMNSSLHGYEIFDPKEQNLDVSAFVAGNATPPRRSTQGFGSDEKDKDAPDSSTHPREDIVPSFRQSLPPPPVELPSLLPFECDICGLTIEVTRKRDWKKHVLHDLRPYICTLENCKRPETAFSNRRDLIKHEKRDHQLIESCYQCIEQDCGAKLKDPESVWLHQRMAHAIPTTAMGYTLANETIIPIEEENHRPNPPSYRKPGYCDSCKDRVGKVIPLWCTERPCRECKDTGVCCGSEKLQLSNCCFDLSTLEILNSECLFCKQMIAPGNLPRSHHLGRHMEEISFLVVTKPYEDWLFYDNTSARSVRSKFEQNNVFFGSP